MVVLFDACATARTGAPAIVKEFLAQLWYLAIGQRDNTLMECCLPNSRDD